MLENGSSMNAIRMEIGKRSTTMENRGKQTGKMIDDQA